jgi:DNA-binding response OmpR family regulator
MLSGIIAAFLKHCPNSAAIGHAATLTVLRGAQCTGVDDFVPKPFEPRELVLRLQNILKRGRGPTGPREEIKMGNYVFHVCRGELKRGDENIKLTERERDLLRLFAQRPGLPISRHELVGDESTGSERAIDVQINRLRRKIEADASNPLYLQTARGTCIQIDDASRRWRAACPRPLSRQLPRSGGRVR